MKFHLFLILTLIGVLVGTGCEKKEQNDLSFENEYKELRSSKDIFFKDDPNSPLLEEDKETFKELKYYAPDPKYKFSGAIQKYEAPEVVELLTSTSELRKFYKYGQFNFEIGGNEHSLQLYKPVDDSGHDPYYFVPFKDKTNITETYGAGRYLDITASESDSITVDFNLAYNPYCVFSPYYSCPLPPRENHLSVEIRAGELNFKSYSTKG